MSTTPQSEVLQAAADLVAAFGEHRRADYFDCFDPAASFIFYTADTRLESRAAYEELWSSWETDHGFQVHHCTSTNQRVDIVADTGVFMHDVATTLDMDGSTDTVHERETIVFARRGDRWVAVHEHLSPRP